jgi:hypothetical protein
MGNRKQDALMDSTKPALSPRLRGGKLAPAKAGVEWAHHKSLGISTICLIVVVSLADFVLPVPSASSGGVDLRPMEADGSGLSLNHRVAEEYGNDVANWQAASPSPGR